MIGTSVADAFASGVPILAEGSAYETLRRNSALMLDPEIFHASLLYNPVGRAALDALHLGYLSHGQRHRLPMILSTDTWRASADRVARSSCRGRSVNADHVAYLRNLVVAEDCTAPIWICGTIGPRGDGYKPAEAPEFEEAVRHHRPQIEELANAGADLLWALTLPAVEEALALAHTIQATAIPYLLSFVIRPDGTVLDGTFLETAIARIDEAISVPPLGYMINCVHPNVLSAALDALDRRGADVGNRLVGFVPNTADLPPETLDGSPELITEEPEALAAQVAVLYRRAGLRLLGGCCGTDERHIGCIADFLVNERQL